jgi:hypothetical protein
MATPPVMARLLITAVAPPRDYNSVAGDLHEEYVQRAAAGSRVVADRWYWSQAIRSIPSLLSYSRVRNSFVTTIVTSIIFLLLLLTMVICGWLVSGELLNYVYTRLGGSELVWSWIGVFGSWAVAAIFGAILSAALRGQSHRLMLAAAIVFALMFVVPPYLGQSAPLDPWQWLLLIGAIPAIGIGATTYQFIRNR